ncbi:unnamed protein product, partial [Nesidiocoris tenuis]
MRGYSRVSSRVAACGPTKISSDPLEGDLPQTWNEKKLERTVRGKEKIIFGFLRGKNRFYGLFGLGPCSGYEFSYEFNSKLLGFSASPDDRGSPK